MNTKIYIDGFNFYYGCLKGTPFKWLDLHRLFIKNICPVSSNEKITLLEQGIYFYTAKISQKAAKTESSVADQSSYLRALATQSDYIKVVEGDYAIQQATAYRIEQHSDNSIKLPKESTKVKVWKIEEKQSDVNLAVDIVTDALTLPELEQIIVVTNDTDVLPAIKRVKKLTNISVAIVLPILKESPARSVNYALLKESNSWSRETITSDELIRAQLPRVVKTDGRKDAIKPVSWYGQPQIINEIFTVLLPVFKCKRNQCWRWLEQTQDETSNKYYIELLDEKRSALMVLEQARNFVAKN